jgi:hypothetical protein
MSRFGQVEMSPKIVARTTGDEHVEDCNEQQRQPSAGAAPVSAPAISPLYRAIVGDPAATPKQTTPPWSAKSAQSEGR